jgi:membrane-associated phospholipid phosphatase
MDLEHKSPSESARRYWRWAAVLTLLAVMAVLVDRPLAQWLLAGNSPYWIKKVCGLAEVFGHGLGVPLLLLTAFILDPLHRRSLVRVGVMAFGSGVLANVFKLGIARYRPHKFDFSGGVLDTFSAWLPLGSAGSAQQSFPSSHTATAAGLAIGLAWLYPRGRWLFATFAGLVAGQRMISGYHFLSDTCFGAAVGCVFAGCCLHPRLLGTRFTRWEQQAKTASPDSTGGSKLADSPIAISRAA